MSAATPTRHRSTAAVVAALLLAVGVLSSGCRPTVAADRAIMIVAETHFVGLANVPGGWMRAV